MKNISKLILLSISFVLFIACQKEDEIGPNDKNNFSIEFDNRIGDQKLVLGTSKATNASGEDFTVTTLNYFVSNIELTKDNGQKISFPDKYFLVKQSDETSLTITLTDVPAANYINLKYTIGVDSVKSISDINQRIGVLDPASYGNDNMYWSWNSGYIFFKMEGISSLSPANSAGLNKYQFHIGGFGGKSSITPNNIRSINLPLNTPATVRKDIAPVAHIIFDVSKVFNAINTISLAKSSVIMAPAAGKVISENYSKAYQLDHIHNEK